VKDKNKIPKDRRFTVVKTEFWFTYGKIRRAYSLLQHYREQRLKRQKRETRRVKQRSQK